MPQVTTDTGSNGWIIVTVTDDDGNAYTIEIRPNAEGVEINNGRGVLIPLAAIQTVADLLTEIVVEE